MCLCVMMEKCLKLVISYNHFTALKLHIVPLCLYKLHFGYYILDVIMRNQITIVAYLRNLVTYKETQEEYPTDFYPC